MPCAREWQVASETTWHLSDLPLDEFSGLGIRPDPIDILVPNASRRRPSHAVTCSVLAGGPPSGSFVRVSEHVLISTPEFLFLRKASSLRLPHLVLLGCELCGSYALSSEDPRGFIDRPRVSSSESLAAFLDGCKGVRGLARARRACRFITEGGASPMESVMASILLMPCSEGGYGIKGACANRRIDIPRSLRTLSDQEFYSVDLFFERGMVCVEYDSDQYHAAASDISRDARRRNFLTHLGYSTVTVTRAQLRSVQEMERAARLICSKTGRQWRSSSHDFARSTDLSHDLMTYRQELPPRVATRT